MADYTRDRPDVFFTGHDGSLRSNRVLAQLAGQYGIDLFIGSTLQLDAEGNSSTVTPRAARRLWRGAPTWGAISRGRRHTTAGLAGHDPAAEECHRTRPQARRAGRRDLPQRRHAERSSIRWTPSQSARRPTCQWRRS